MVLPSITVTDPQQVGARGFHRAYIEYHIKCRDRCSGQLVGDAWHRYRDFVQLSKDLKASGSDPLSLPPKGMRCPRNPGDVEARRASLEQALRSFAEKQNALPQVLSDWLGIPALHASTTRPRQVPDTSVTRLRHVRDTSTTPCPPDDQRRLYPAAVGSGADGMDSRSSNFEQGVDSRRLHSGSGMGSRSLHSEKDALRSLHSEASELSRISPLRQTDDVFVKSAPQRMKSMRDLECSGGVRLNAAQRTEAEEFMVAACFGSLVSLALAVFAGGFYGSLLILVFWFGIRLHYTHVKLLPDKVTSFFSRLVSSAPPTQVESSPEHRVMSTSRNDTTDTISPSSPQRTSAWHSSNASTISTRISSSSAQSLTSSIGSNFGSLSEDNIPHRLTLPMEAELDRWFELLTLNCRADMNCEGAKWRHKASQKGVDIYSSDINGSNRMIWKLRVAIVVQGTGDDLVKHLTHWPYRLSWDSSFCEGETLATVGPSDLSVYKTAVTGPVSSREFIDIRSRKDLPDNGGILTVSTSVTPSQVPGLPYPDLKKGVLRGEVLPGSGFYCRPLEPFPADSVEAKQGKTKWIVETLGNMDLKGWLSPRIINLAMVSSMTSTGVGMMKYFDSTDCRES